MKMTIAVTMLEMMLASVAVRRRRSSDPGPTAQRGRARLEPFDGEVRAAERDVRAGHDDQRPDAVRQDPGHDLARRPVGDLHPQPAEHDAEGRDGRDAEGRDRQRGHQAAGSRLEEGSVLRRGDVQPGDPAPHVAAAGEHHEGGQQEREARGAHEDFRRHLLDREGLHRLVRVAAASGSWCPSGRGPDPR